MNQIEKHLHKRQYQTANGDWSTLYYGIFTDWKGIRRCFPLGQDLQGARNRLGELKRLDMGQYDFDAEKKERAKAKVKAMTLGEYLDNTYLPLTSRTPSYPTKMAQSLTLSDYWVIFRCRK
jgi:hypothetical protein